MLWLFMMLGCDSAIMDLSGSIEGNSFTPVTGFYGGPYIVFFNIELDCKEMHWVEKIYRNGEAPYQRDLEALQINFNDSDVVTGTYSTGGEAPIRSSYFTISGDAFEVVTSTDGLLTMSDVDGSWAMGNFDLTFGEDLMNGTFTIPFCTNLVH